ncbi:A-kinase anchor protein 17B-like isoform X2 [Ahaetulla prasina]|uniref:A-kinase anchor protein 17B-like isoform X2 n=1 Tax=Ahaetulla prasina TaxID=499056 RepID=UPI0026478A5A|nr:A-kinase anchor protein 17B-like isoform X2 [Ahaetulla prasina]
MTVTLVCDPSEATELCAAQQLYLKPVAKLTISVVLPEHTGSTRAFSKWEVMDKLKNIISPDQLTSVKVSKSTKAFIRFEGEAETKRLVSSLKEKLHGQLIKLNGFKEDLRVVATEAPPDGPPAQESEPQAKTRKQLEEEEQSQVVPDCVYLEGLPCKWFAPKGSDSETPSEEVLRAVFGTFGEIKNIDIPMLDPYREEMVGRSRNHFVFRGMRSFEAFVQYQEPESFARAMEALKGMKLMFKGDDGKALACNIKNFVLSSGQAEAHLPEPQPEEEKVSSPAPVEDTRKEETDVPHLEHPAAEDETQPAYPSALLENVTIEEEKEEQFLAGDSPPSFRKALSNEPAARAVTSHLTENVAHPFRAGGLLQVTVTQDCQAIESSPDRWAYLRPHLRSFADAPCVAKPKKQKVYETEEFIHYLLNYYQTPRYARICPSAQSPSDTSWWNRVVSCSGDGFRVKLKNRDEDCWTDESLGSDLPENEPREDDEGDPWEIIDGRSEPAEDQACPQEFSESYQGEWDDSLEEDSVGSPPDILRSPIPGGRNNISRPKTSQEQTTEMTALSSPTMYKLKDLLEEISSDSEYFSEALNETRNPSEQRNGGYQGSCKTWTLHHNQQKAKELLIRVQNVGCEGHDGRRNARSFCSGAECCDSPAMKPKTRFKRSGGKLWYEEPKIQWLSSEEERDLSRKKKKKKRKRFSDSSFPDEEAQFLETNHRRELEAFSEIQRKCSKLIHRKAKCKTLRPLEGTFEIKDLIHFSASPSQEEAQQMTTGKGNLDVGERRHKADDRQRLSRRLVER